MSIPRVFLVCIFPAFSCIRTEYGELLGISPYSVPMQENAGKMGTRITPNTDTFYALWISSIRNLPPLICRYCLSSEWLWNLDVMMKSCPSASKTSISEAWHFDVLKNAETVSEVRVNFPQLGIFSSCQVWIQSAMARK